MNVIKFLISLFLWKIVKLCLRAVLNQNLQIWKEYQKMYWSWSLADAKKDPKQMFAFAGKTIFWVADTCRCDLADATCKNTEC